MKQHVVLIDLDLGGANLHTCLGIRSPKSTLGDFIQKKADAIEKLLLPTTVENLKMISGSNDHLEIANLPYAQKLRLIRQFKTLEADFILLDLGGGTNLNVLDFFLSSDYGVIVAAPEPTSLENASLFIKCVMMRNLKMLLKQYPIADLKNRIKDPRNRETVRTFWDLLRLIRSFDEKSSCKIEEKLQEFKFGIVLNKLREPSESRIGSSFKSMIQRTISIDMDYVGQIHYDEKVPMSVKKLEPLMTTFPHSRASHSIRQIAKRILGMDHLSSMPIPPPPLFSQNQDKTEEAARVAEKNGEEPRQVRPEGLRFYL